jgi:hypothetical protein
MPDKNNNLYLYEALELRGEYKARKETLNNILPENVRSGYLDNNELETVAELDIKKIREEIKKIENKEIKLNDAIQFANYANMFNVYETVMSIASALYLRKNTNDKIGELSNRLIESAYNKVIYKEGRNIIKKPSDDYIEVKNELEEKRLIFRELNRKLREISFITTINFKDEE